MKNDITIGFLTSVDPENRNRLSGTHYYVFHLLKKTFPKTIALGPYDPGIGLLKFIQKTTKILLGRPINLEHNLILAYKYKRFFEKRISTEKPDVIFAIRASTHISMLKTDVPIIYYTDTTFKKMYNYYSWFSNFLFTSVWEGNYIEQKAIDNANRCIFSSKWAADSAISDYQAPPDKVKIIPFGPNMINIPEKRPPERNKPNVCKLLFLGKEFTRKGGDIVYETFKILKDRRFPVSLTFVGSEVPAYVDDENIEIIDYIDKNTVEGMQEFEAIWREAHFLFLPTRAECFGIAFVEASAWGIPSIATDTGGVADAVLNGKNGFRMSPEAKPIDYANIIERVFTNYQTEYVPLALKSRSVFEETFAPQIIAQHFEVLIKDVVNNENRKNISK